MELSLNRAHARSYGADLPLGHFTDSQLTRITKDDRAYYASRPISLRPIEHRWTNDRASKRHIAKVRSLLGELNVCDETPAAEQEALPCKEGHQHEWLQAVQRANGETIHTPFYRDSIYFECVHCGAFVTVESSRIAPTPKVPCPYAARNAKEAKDPFVYSRAMSKAR